MELYELSQGERFLIEVIREFKFLSTYEYTGSGFVVAGREYSVTFTSYSLVKSITIIWQETQDLNVIFERKSFLRSITQELSCFRKTEKCPTSLKALAQIIQSDYMYLV